MPTQVEQEISTALPVLQTGFPQGDASTTEQVCLPQASKQLWRRRPSPLVWRFAVAAGDSIVLTGVLGATLALLAPSYAGLNVSNSPLGLLHTPMTWLFLVVASWSVAVSITQAQELQCTGSVLKSPLFAFASLMLMLVFCMGLFFLFIGAAVISYTRIWLFFLGMATPLLSVWRVMLAEVIHLPCFRRRAVIVGVNQAGISIATELRQARRPGANVLGYIRPIIDDRDQIDGLPVFGGRSALARLVQDKMIDVIIMAIDYQTYPELFQEALHAAQYGIGVVPVTVMYENTSGKIPVEYIVDQWYTVMPSEYASSPFYICWNRLLDLTFGLCGLIMLALLLPLLAVLIYLDSPGPIFYTQERTGYHGRTFSIYKFRSMHTEAEQAKRPAWVTKGDPRITRVGRFLRATHLDELPQVLNILRGEMSLIGPRPERPAFVAELEKSSLFYRYRLSVKPGLTGWAQVKYGYGVTDQDELVKLQYDLYYIKHRSLLLDLLIILKTVVEVGFGHGS
jgi:exopolysaccharide biosynthesis polyprenyl glycosylphosphotransferase